MKKNIFLLWLQGWNKAPWLQKEVLKSWSINNPDWNIELIEQNNLINYVDDIDYIFDNKKNITPQAKSDIIRLSLLKNIGGVWADSTMLCMQPLDHWIFNAIEPSGLWMYHGHGGGLSSDLGPASWFIAANNECYLIKEWKYACDYFWNMNNEAKSYFWMDGLFRDLIENNQSFKSQWLKTPFLYCEKPGSSHSLANYNYGMAKNSKYLKNILKDKPPYALKLSSQLETIFPSFNSIKFKKSNVYFAISMSKRKFIYKHNFDIPVSKSVPIKIKIRFIISNFLKFIRKLIV